MIAYKKLAFSFSSFGALAKARTSPVSVTIIVRQISSLLKGGNLSSVLLFDVKCYSEWYGSHLKLDLSIHLSFMRQSSCWTWSLSRSGLLVQSYTFLITVDDLFILAYVTFRLLKLRSMVNITPVVPILCIESMQPKTWMPTFLSHSTNSCLPFWTLTKLLSYCDVVFIYIYLCICVLSRYMVLSV